MPCNTEMRPAESASTGWKQYDVLPTLWDVYRGRKMLNIEQFVGGSLDVWATMTNELVQSKWAPSTRALYQGWLEAFLFFCKWKAVAPLPINPEIFSNWITRIAVSYCFSTMQIAVSAIIGFCTLNNFENPIKQHPLCSAALAGAKRARCGAYNADRKALDAQFIIAMWRGNARAESPHHQVVARAMLRPTRVRSSVAWRRNLQLENLRCSIHRVRRGVRAQLRNTPSQV